MRESYYVSVLWPGRRESSAECARRVEMLFRFLAACDPIFAHWFEKAETLEEALQLQFEPSYETLVRLFGKEDYQFDGDGVMFGAWTGQAEDGHGAMIRIRCGSAADVIPNSCLLDLPYCDPEAGRVLTLPVVSAVLRAVVLALEPEWGFVTPDDLRSLLREEGDLRRSVGWLNYFSPRRSPLPPLPEPVRVEPIEGHGSLVILTPECLSSTNPEHVSLARRVQAALDEKDLLAPVVYPPPRPPLKRG